MSKVTITELASVLMDKHGLKRTEAELFIRQFVVVVNESLTEDKIAKVKGLGTFKVTSVSPRKSVDVNTGEPIIIDGRDKITFTADTSMRDLVNAPFAQFETVVVNEGVDFSVIDENHKNELKDEVAETENGSQATLIESTSAVDNVTSPVPTVEPEQTLGAETVSEPEPVTEPKPELITEPEPEIVTEHVQDRDAEQDIPKWQTDRLASENEKLVEANDYLYEQIRSFKIRTTVLLTSLILVIVVATAGFFYLGSLLNRRDNRIAYLESQTVSLLDKMVQKQVPVDDSITAKAKTDSMKAVQEQADMLLQKQKEDKAKENLIAAEKTAEVKKEVEAKKTAEVKKNTETKNTIDTKQADSQSIYNKDARVRTGAYLITGIAKTVTVQPGQTLSSISKACLGPGMECYIEAVNNGKTTFNAGEKIKIPELRLKKKKSAQ